MSLGYTIGSLFSGILGLELGLERAGLGPVEWCVEIDPFCRSVILKHKPGVELFEDVREVGAVNLRRVDIICGGFPCQDTSGSNPRGAGLDGDRSGLWFEMQRIIYGLQPRWVVVENPISGASRWVDTVRSGLEWIGYAVLPVPIAASDLGAPHRRSRVFVVAYGAGVRRFARRVAESQSSEERTPALRSHRWPTEPRVARVVHGVPAGSHRRRAIGNSCTPPQAETIGHIIRILDAA